MSSTLWIILVAFCVGWLAIIGPLNLASSVQWVNRLYLLECNYLQTQPIKLTFCFHCTVVLRYEPSLKKMAWNFYYKSALCLVSTVSGRANHLLGRAWVSPTLAWLHCTRCVYLCLFGLTPYRKFYISTFKYFTMIEPHTCTSAKPCEWVPDCGVGMKESDSEGYSSWMHWQHAWQLTFWTMVRVWRSRDKASWEWLSDSRV